MIEIDPVVARLFELKITEGWAVRNGKIVVWENSTKVPDELQEFVNLD
jgi:hypothetical protein